MTEDINAQIDKRKIDRLVYGGIISAEEVANAPIVILCPMCLLEQDAVNDVCDCGAQLKGESEDE